MSKPKTPRDIQVRHRLSGAALLGVKEPNPPAMAIDAAPRAGDIRPWTRPAHGMFANILPTIPRGFAATITEKPLIMRGTFGDEEAPPVVTEIDDE